MHYESESFLQLRRSFKGLALLCAAAVAGFGAVDAQAAVQTAGQSTGQKSRLVPQVTTDTEAAGFRMKSQQLAIQPINLDVTRFAFTAPGRVASTKVQTVERSFTFTPSRSAKGVSVGMTTRTVAAGSAERTAAADPSIGLAPGGYNFDLSVGYRGLSVSGGVSRVDAGIGGLGAGRTREGVDVGLGYGQRNWKAGLLASAERDSAYLVPRAGSPDPRYALEARGAVALSPAISVGGSLRYRLAPENPTPLDPNKDDRAVMLGGAVAF